jgi:hypothetical protein
MVLLIGISAKTAILIVEFAIVQHQQGHSIFDAAINAAELHLRCRYGAFGNQGVLCSINVPFIFSRIV